MTNPTYVEFLEDHISQNYEPYEVQDSDEICNKDHGIDKDSFMFAYLKDYRQEGAKIYHLNKPKALRLGFMSDFGDMKTWHTVRIQAWRSGSKNDPNYKFDFVESLKEDISEMSRVTCQLRLFDYIPLYVSGCGIEEGYYYIDKDTKMTPEALEDAMREWNESGKDSFYEFLHENKEEL